jgi:peptidoglycan/xylan/chitin deacetylase (PgdA/CDA1 family)
VGTFGVTGQWAEQNPELTQRIVDEGHQIINHTYDHASFTGDSPGTVQLTDTERRDEIETTEQIIEDITGGYQTRPFFRFPYGDYDAGALDLLGELGFSYTMWWSCDTQGWNGFTPDEIIELCGTDADNGGPGAILLMHVANDNDWEATEPLVENYLEAGYDFVTLEEMVQP